MNDPNEQTIRNSVTETEVVDRTAQEMLTAFHAKDGEKANSYYAPDAIIATAGRPAAKDARAVSRALRDDLADPNFKMILSHEKTQVSGDLAYRRGSYKITATNPETKQPEEIVGTYLTVFKKQVDGNWKIVEDFGV